MMNSFARWMVRHPLWLGANLLVTALLGLYALHIRIESSIASVLPAGDPEVEYYAKIRETFGSDDVAVIGVRADDLFAALDAREDRARRRCRRARFEV